MTSTDPSVHAHVHELSAVDAAIAATATSIADLTRRVRDLETDVSVLAQAVQELQAKAHTHTDPVPPLDPTPPPNERVAVFRTTGKPADLVALMKNLAYDVIEMERGLYAKWTAVIDVVRPADKPITVRPGPGTGDVVFDGTGLADNTMPFKIGWQSTGLAANVTFDARGQGGRFVMQNYRIGKTGLIETRRFENIGFHGVLVRNCEGGYDGGAKQHAHAIYLGALKGGTAYRSKNWASNDWIIEGPASRMLNGFHVYSGVAGIGVDGAVATDWKVRDLNRAAFVWSPSTGVLIDRWEIDNCDCTIDNTPNEATGEVRNVHSRKSGALAEGQGFWKAGKLRQGVNVVRES